MTSTPAHDAVAEAREEQEATPVQGVIEIPDMHPDAALEMTKQVVAHVAETVGMTPDEVPDIGPGTSEWDRVGGSFRTRTTGDDPQVDVLVIEVVYLPSIADAFIAMLFQQLMSAASASPRGSDVHRALLQHAHGHAYDDGLPEQEKLEDVEVETMGGKPDTKCPECHVDLERGDHLPLCPHKVHNISSMSGGD